MSNPLFLLIVLAFVIFYWVYYCDGRKRANRAGWQALPTREQYLAQHPDALVDDQIACHHCHHRDLQAQGLVHLADFRHQYVCPHCRQVLFRTQ